MKSTTPRKPFIGLLASAVVSVASLGLPHAVSAQAPAEGELMSLAVRSEKYGKLSIAETLYQRVLQNNPTNQYAHHRLGVIAAQSGEFKLAIASFRSAQRSGPPSVELLNDFGAALYLTDDLETAEKLLKASLTIDPNSAQAKNNLKMVLLKREWRYKHQATALMEDRAAREAIEHSRAAARIREIAEAKTKADLQAARRATVAAPKPAHTRIEHTRAAARTRTIAKASAEANLQVARRAMVSAPKPAQTRTVPKLTPQSQEDNSFLPRFRLPQVKLPQAKMPQLHLPKFHMPEFHMPEFFYPW